MRVHIDWTRCDGHGACAELLPELLTTDEWGYPLVTGDQRDPDVPTALRKHARRAVKACPLQALRLVD
jgi:ferredoxin